MASKVIVRGAGGGRLSGRQRPAPARRRAPRRKRPPSMEACGLLAEAVAPGLRPFVLVAAWSGLRLFEVAALEARDVTWDVGGGAMLHVRHGKGDREGWSWLFPVGADALRTHMLREPSSPRRPLLMVNSRGGGWDRKSVNKAWGKARGLVAGCAETTFHDLRKAHASWLLDQGASDIDVAVQLRHIDRLGRPDPGLVREVYGFPAIDAALARVKAVGA